MWKWGTEESVSQWGGMMGCDKDSTAIVGFEDGQARGAKEWRNVSSFQLENTRKQILLQSLQKRAQPCPHLDFHQWGQFQISCLQSGKITHLCCLKPLVLAVCYSNQENYRIIFSCKALTSLPLMSPMFWPKRPPRVPGNAPLRPSGPLFMPLLWGRHATSRGQR